MSEASMATPPLGLVTAPVAPMLAALDLDALGAHEGSIVVLATMEGKLDPAGRKLNSLTGKQLSRALESEAFGALKSGEVMSLSYPARIAASRIVLLKLDAKADALARREAGATVATAVQGDCLLAIGTQGQDAVELALGYTLRQYAFAARKSAREEAKASALRVMHPKAESQQAGLAQAQSVAEGVFFCRDLVSEPANVLTTVEFAARLEGLRALGLEVEVLDEPQMQEMGMGALLGVGQGSPSPSKIVVMRWNGGGDEPPLALVGKGVVFDTGGISLKPAAGMEEMTMDMGGAAVVSGVMRVLAARKARANVVGLVGLVENMPDGHAQRPGDIVTSMKGDTIEVINTDAEGRLVLADVLWYAQERFGPSAVIDLATLTGAIIIALGYENAGVFSNDDAFTSRFLAAAKAEGEGAWQLPLGPAYDAQLKSPLADMKNVGGRDGGSITAAQFLQRFIKDGTPWMHIDIAGVASRKKPSAFAPAGASGWGVAALNRLIADHFER